MTVQQTVAEAMAVLKQHGYKHTKRREQLLQIVAQASGVVSAGAVHKIMAETHPGVSYDTVYRNLYTCVSLGILEISERNGEKMFFMHCAHTHRHHHHFICDACGRIFELGLCPMEDIQQQMPQFSITGHRFEVFGLCADCQAAGKQPLIQETDHHCDCGHH